MLIKAVREQQSQLPLSTKVNKTSEFKSLTLLFAGKVDGSRQLLPACLVSVMSCLSNKIHKQTKRLPGRQQECISDGLS